ncbi:MAG: response regulator [Desulfobacterales bacterium]|nr:response regulator [Desulfobacterales bacterium]
MRILIVEDDLVSRRLLETILSPYGECHTAVDGEEAVQAFKMAHEEGAPYALICLDIMMPKMDGQEALKQIREIEKERRVAGPEEVKILMVTALDDPKSVVEAFYRGGATSYIVKPIIKKKILNEIRKFDLLQ